jgi:hypothetical protein
MLENRQAGGSSTHKDTVAEFNETLEAFNCNLVWRAVYSLIELKDFDWSPVWIARKLGVSEADAMDALIGLTQLGLIRKTATGYEQGKLQVITEEDTIKPEKLINHHQLLSEEILNLMSPDRGGAYYNFMAPGDKDALRELYTEVKEVFQRFHDKCQKNKKNYDSVFAFSFTTVDVTTSGNKGGKS